MVRGLINTLTGLYEREKIMLEWEEYFEPHILERGRNYARKGAETTVPSGGTDVIPLSALISAAKRDQLEKVLLSLAGEVDFIENADDEDDYWV